MIKTINFRKNICEDATKLMSKSLIAMIETVLGKPDEDGNFNDYDRIKDFMLHSEVFSELADKDMVYEKGLLEESIPWTHALGKRYSDIYAKLKDSRHLYIFNEMGEALIFHMIEVCKYGEMEYLEKYGVDYYSIDDCVTEKIEDIDLLLDNLEGSLRKDIKEGIENGEIGFDEEEFLSKALNIWSAGGGDIDEFIDIVTDVYSNVLYEYRYYLNETIPQEVIEDKMTFAETYKGDKASFVAALSREDNEHIVWDNDYLFVLDKINNPKELDRFFKLMNEPMIFSTTGYFDLFSENDYRQDVALGYGGE